MLDRANPRLAATVVVMFVLTAANRVDATEKAATPPVATAPKSGAPVAPEMKPAAAPKKDDAHAKPSTKDDAHAKSSAKDDAHTTATATPPEKEARPVATGEGEKDVKDVKAPAKAPAKKKEQAAKNASPKPGEGPSPASPPPLTVGGLRDEIRRDPASLAIDPASPPRTKLEQMLVELAKTREALRDDTARLEAMMGDGEGAAPAGTPSGEAPAPGPAKPAAKNPLDVLAKALRGIKPELAAPIVARLDKRLAATVLLRMPPVDAGKIMGALKPDTAAELATQISMRTTPGGAKQ